MAKIILRAGKIAVAVVVPLAVLGIILYGINVSSIAETSPEIAEITIPVEVQQMQEEAAAYIANKQYDLAQQSYYDIIAGFPGTRYAMDALARIVKYQIAQEDFTQAEATTENLLTDYSAHPDIVEVILDLANKNGSIIKLYQHIVSNYPSHDLAVRAQYRIARRYIRRNEYIKAQAAIDKLLTDYSAHPDIVKVIGNIAYNYRKKKEYDRLIALYQDILSKHPSHNLAVRAQSGLVTCYWMQKEDSKAEAAVEKLLSNYSDHPDIVKVVGRLADKCYEGKGYDRAVQLYQYILSNYPSHNWAVHAQAGLARCYIQKNEDVKAQAAVEKLLEDYSDYPDIAECIGGVAGQYRYDGHRDRAIELYQHILSKYPSHNRAIWVQAGLARCYIQKKEDVKAQAVVEKLLSNYSDHPDIAECIGAVAGSYRSKKYDRAVELYQYIFSKYPSHNWVDQARSDDDIIEVFAVLADSYRKKKTDRAIELYQYILSDHFSDHESVRKYKMDALSSLARIYIVKKDYSNTEAVVEKLLANYFDYPDVAKYIVAVAKSYPEEKADRAVELHQYILSNYPSHNWAVRAQSGLAMCYIRDNDMGNAQAAIETFLTDYSDHPDIVKVIGGLADYCSTKNVDIAIELYQHIASEYPSNDSVMGVQFRLIKNYMSQKDYINAQAAIDKLLTDYSDHPDIVKVICNIADSCRKENADIAIGLYQYIISDHPSHDLAIRSQSDLAKCYIQENDDANAQAAIDKLLADYSAHPDIVKVIGDIADDCRKKNIDRAIELYQYITNMYHSDDLAIYAQSDLAKCYIQKNDYAMALYCIDSATKDYPDHKEVAWLLNAKADCYFNMGAESQVEEVVDEILQSHLTNGGKHGALRGVAISYRESGNYEGSLDLCQRVLDNDPSEWNRLRAYTGIAMSYIGLNDDPNVNETLDIICADFADHDKLGRAIYLIGEDYYTQACKMKKEGLDEAAKESFLKANNVWKRVEVESLNKHLAAARTFFLGITSGYIGDPNTAIECLQKVVTDYPTCNYVSNARYHIPQYARALRGKYPARAQEADMLIEKYLVEYIDNHPDKALFQDCLRNLGTFYYSKAQYFQSLDRFEQLIEMDDKELGKVVDRMSTCYEQLGSPETAQELRATYQQSLDM